MKLVTLQNRERIGPIFNDSLLLLNKERRNNMNILVIGNGVDIAHGLPTGYKDFLLFIFIFQHLASNTVFAPSYEKEEKCWYS